jgi:hypothetical protein
MALSAIEKRSPQHPQHTDGTEREYLPPFDRRELDKLPTATDQDPPYRPWWVIDRT